MYLKINLILIFLFLTTITLAQRAGSLDTTFNHTGLVYNIIAGDTINAGYSMAIQNDGKIVVVGSTTKKMAGIEKLAILRYNTDGTLDVSFNNTGYTITTIDSPGSASLCSVVIQPNGKILTLGTAGYFYNEFVLVRYNSNGVPDTTFGNNGIVITSDTASASSLALESDGKIIAGGSNNNSNFIVTRFDSSGHPDNTFGSSGTAITDFGFTTVNKYINLNSLTLQSDGKIIAVGCAASNVPPLLALVRYNTDGSLDASFGSNGVDTTNYRSYTEGIATAVVVQSDNKIVIAGTIGEKPYGSFDTFAIARYNSNGTFDTTFADKGIAKSSISGYATSLVLQPNGKIIAAGTNYNVGYALMRLNTTGTPDTSFGNGGDVFTSVVPIRVNPAQSVALQGDGKIVAAGFGYNNNLQLSYFTLARYNNDITAGILNLSSLTDSLLVYPNPVHENETLDYILTNGEILTIKLYDIMGRLIKTFMNNLRMISGEHKQQLSFENLAAGTYIITISNANSKSESIKVVKQ